MFAFFLANGTAAPDVLGPVGDYRPALFEYGSPLEMVIAIYSNVLDIAADGTVTNDDHAMRRAAQYLRCYIDPTYTVEPPFEEWEIELH